MSVTYDENETDADNLEQILNSAFQTAVSTPGILPKGTEVGCLDVDEDYEAHVSVSASDSNEIDCLGCNNTVAKDEAAPCQTCNEETCEDCLDEQGNCTNCKES
tara:strand:+ start:42 stop:353 length:312 start_codon:yes stop_codon:yes gene_type:complete